MHKKQVPSQNLILGKLSQKRRRQFEKGFIWGSSTIKGTALDNNLTNHMERAMEKGVFSICNGRGTLKLGLH